MCKKKNAPRELRVYNFVLLEIVREKYLQIESHLKNQEELIEVVNIDFDESEDTATVKIRSGSSRKAVMKQLCDILDKIDVQYFLT